MKKVLLGIIALSSLIALAVELQIKGDMMYLDFNRKKKHSIKTVSI